MNFQKEKSRFEVFMEHFPRSVESAVHNVTSGALASDCLHSRLCKFLDGSGIINHESLYNFFFKNRESLF